MKKPFLLIVLLLAAQQLTAPVSPCITILAGQPISHVTLKDVALLFNYYHVQQQDRALRQVVLETGNLQSEICTANHNLFGMRFAPQRQTTALGEQNGCAVYANFAACVQDYALWQRLYYKGGDYYAFLQRIGYAEDTQYVQKLQALNLKYFLN
jgi:hypothetical protein